MLLINETFIFLPNQSLLVEYNQFSCISNTKIWLLIHFIITRSIESLLIQVVFWFYIIMILFFFSYWKHISNIVDGNWLSICDLDRYSLMIIVLKKEMKLIFVYVYIAFVYTWLDLVYTNYTITYLNFLRWLIEASLLPQLLFLTFVSYYFLCMEDFFQTYRVLYVPIIIIRIPLFILMRYAESNSDFFINQYQISMFNTFCFGPPIKKSMLYIH